MMYFFLLHFNVNQQPCNNRKYSVATLKLTSFLIVICSMMSILECTPQIYRDNYKKSYMCTDSQTGRELFVGDTFTRPGQCIRVQCLGTLDLWEDSCLVPRSLKGDCTTRPPPNEFLEYPKCCPLYVCKTYEMNANGQVEQTNTYDHYGNLRKSHLTEIIVINNPGNNMGGEANTPRRQYQL